MLTTSGGSLDLVGGRGVGTHAILSSAPTTFAGEAAVVLWFEALQPGPGSQHLENTLIVALGSSVLAVIIGAWTAYVLSNFRIAREQDFEFWILSMRMIPPLSVVVPFYLMFSVLHLFDTRLGLILAYLIFNVPLVVWVLKGFFSEVPREI